MSCCAASQMSGSTIGSCVPGKMHMSCFEMPAAALSCFCDLRLKLTVSPRYSRLWMIFVMLERLQWKGAGLHNGQRFVCLFIVSGKTLVQRSDSLSGVLVLCLTLIHDLSPLLRASIGSPTPIGQTPGFFGTVFLMIRGFFLLMRKNLVVPLPIGQTSAFSGTVFTACEKEIDILLLTNYNVYELMFLFVLGGEADAYRVSDAGHGFLR